MAVKINKQKCTGCKKCIKACPVDAITLKSKIAVVNKNLCIDCGACVKVCPKSAISV